MTNGASGFALTGREKAYATDLWLADPAAFFLHPEGPLSETTPDEWRAKQQAERREQFANLSPYANVAYLRKSLGLDGAYNARGPSLFESLIGGSWRSF